MEFFKQNAIWIGLLLGSGGMLLWPYLRGESGVSGVESGDAVLLINRSNALVLDVRDEAEYAAGHIAGARHIPLASLESRLGELEKFRDKAILVHCQSGVRSARACRLLRKHAFTRLHDLRGGLQAWIAAKLPVVKGER